MNAPLPPAGATAPPGARLARALRYLYPRADAAVAPAGAPAADAAADHAADRALRVGDETLEHRAIRAWSAGLMRVFGFRLRRVGTPLPGATMFVANHVSWIDIETAAQPAHDGLRRQARDPELAGGRLAGAARRNHLPPPRQHRIAGRRAARNAGAAAQRPLGRRVPRRRHPRRRRDRPVPRAHLPGRGRGRRAGAAGRAALRRSAATRSTWSRSSRAKASSATSCACSASPRGMAEVHFLEPIAPGEADGRRRIAELARQRIIEAMTALKDASTRVIACSVSIGGCHGSCPDSQRRANCPGLRYPGRD